MNCGAGCQPACGAGYQPACGAGYQPACGAGYQPAADYQSASGGLQTRRRLITGPTNADLRKLFTQWQNATTKKTEISLRLPTKQLPSSATAARGTRMRSTSATAAST